MSVCPSTPTSKALPVRVRAAKVPKEPNAPEKKQAKMLTCVNVHQPGRKKSLLAKPAIKQKTVRPTMKVLVKIAKKYHKKDSASLPKLALVRSKSAKNVLA